MSLAQDKSELGLIESVVAGEPADIDRFLAIAERPVWSAVATLEGSGPAGEAALLRVIEGLGSDGYARLRRFDGRSSLASFLALLAREILIAEVASSLLASPRQTWARFERYFGNAIRKSVLRRFPRADAAARDDRYQDVCIGLIENDYRRLRAFSGHGSFEGYVLQVVDRLLLNLLRREAPRRRLPVAVEKMPPLEQAVFVQLAWRGANAEPDQLREQLRSRFADVEIATVKNAIACVLASVEAIRVTAVPTFQALPGEAGHEGGAELPDSGLTPEQAQLAAEKDAAYQTLAKKLADTIADGSADERAYFRVFVAANPPLPAREIARLMGRPVEDIYEIKARLMRRLAPFGRAQKNLALSVFGVEE